MKNEKLNSMRILEQQKIAYTVREFPDTIHTANGVADYLELSQESVYKTLVVLNNRGKPLLVMIAGCQELKMKTLAKAVGEKKVQMATHEEAERLTELKTGGISALALRHKNYPVYIGRSALQLKQILVSAGKRGVMLELEVSDLIKASQAKVIDLYSIQR
jgi:Cys-tRNA(Pro)/Cys-tRNA(Cys) deacylase